MQQNQQEVLKVTLYLPFKTTTTENAVALPERNYFYAASVKILNLSLASLPK